MKRPSPAGPAGAARWISWILTAGERPAAAAPVRAFRRFLLLHGCARSWLWVAFAAGATGATEATGETDLWVPGLVASALWMTAAFAMVWHRRHAALAPLVALPALLFQLGTTFPLTDNHFVLELYAMGLLCLAAPRGEATGLVLGALRWLCVIVLFHTGLQKVLYGQYFDGQFLAFMVATGDRFATAFAPIVPAAQLEALRALDPMRTGQGPFRVDSWLFVAASNLVWILEMGLAPLLAWARTRAVATAAAIALVAGIQLAAHEAGFALLFVNLLLVFTARGNERLLPFMALVYAGALLAAAGLVPSVTLERGWL